MQAIILAHSRQVFINRQRLLFLIRLLQLIINHIVACSISSSQGNPKINNYAVKEIYTQKLKFQNEKKGYLWQGICHDDEFCESSVSSWHFCGGTFLPFFLFFSLSLSVCNCVLGFLGICDFYLGKTLECYRHHKGFLCIKTTSI